MKRICLLFLLIVLSISRVTVAMQSVRSNQKSAILSMSDLPDEMVQKIIVQGMQTIPTYQVLAYLTKQAGINKQFCRIAEQIRYELYKLCLENIIPMKPGLKKMFFRLFRTNRDSLGKIVFAAMYPLMSPWDSDSEYPLLFAVLTGANHNLNCSEKLCAYLLKIGFNPNIRSIRPGFSPLGLAITESVPTIAKLLLVAGANPNEDVAMVWRSDCARFSPERLEIAQNLLKYGATNFETVLASIEQNRTCLDDSRMAEVMKNLYLQASAAKRNGEEFYQRFLATL